MNSYIFIILVLNIGIVIADIHQGNNSTNNSKFGSLDADVTCLNVNSNSSNSSDLKQVNVTSYALHSVKLLEWAEPEEKFYRMIKQLKFEEKSENLKCRKAIFSYIKDYEETTTTDHLNESIISTNPLAMYKMIWRLANKYPEIRNSCKSTNEEMSSIVNYYEIHSTTFNIALPTESDLEDAVSGIIRIQNYCQIDTLSLSRGIIGNSETGVILNYENCLEISRITATVPAVNFIHFTIEWLEIARDLAFQHFKNVNKEITEIDEEIKKLHLKHDEIWDKNGTKMFYQFELFSNRLENNSTSYKNEKFIKRKHQSSVLRQNAMKKKLGNGDLTDNEAFLNSWDLCAGQNLQTEHQKSKLKCWESRNSHPYFLINPLQIELLNDDPVLLQIYNFIGDKAIKEILNYTKPNLHRSRVQVNATNDSETEPNFMRTSVNAWISNKNEPFIQSLYKKIQFVTGLEVFGNGSDRMQVAQYSSLGSHYDIHVDEDDVPAIRKITADGKIEFRRRRIATFMTYLSDVEVGGNTAFPTLGVATRPVKNSAVFWYNLHPNATNADDRTEHTACPVALGRKDISTTWIIDLPNIFNKQCPLDEYATNNLETINELTGLLN